MADGWRRKPGGSVGISVAVHALALLGLAGVLHGTGKVVPYKLPGSARGTQLLTYYAPGSRAASSGAMALRTPVTAKVERSEKPAMQPAAEAPAVNAARGVGDSAQSGLGDGDVTIAMSTTSPHPLPDLSTMRPGTSGDVVLDAVIDEHGKVAALTVVEGLGKPIDDAVMATVRGWSYTPAMRNGVPVASEQELHFHYERG